MQGVTLGPWPTFDEDEISSVVEVLKSGKVNYWTGDQVKSFESEFANFVGTRHAIAVANGTLAIELALRAIDIMPGDEVIVTPRSFIASAMAIAVSGAIPIFVDVDWQCQNITVETIAPYLSKKTKAIVCVHLAGWPCDMPGILELAKAKGIKVIEDCAQAHGASIGGKKVGSFGEIGVFSFCQDKILTTAGEGGMLVMNDENLFKKAWSFKDHGKNWEKIKAPTPGHFRWIHDYPGSNYRLSEIQAAVGRKQLSKLSDWLEIRRENATQFLKNLSQCALLENPEPPKEVRHAYYKYYTLLKTEALKEDWNKERILSEMNQYALPCFYGSCSEIYLEKAFEHVKWGGATPCPVAKKLGASALMFLVHPGVTKNDIDKISEGLITILKKAKR